MISLQHISLYRGQKRLLEKVDWLIHAREKIGLVGANGCGKSSLFALLRQIIPADEGELYLPAHLRIAHLAQETPPLAQSALDYVIDGDQELRTIEQALQQTEDGHQIAQLHGRLAAIDAYSAPARAGQLLYGLGFTAAEHQQPVAAFSGGWRMRLNLAQALMCRSDLLLLDEPTNHLDLDALIWLEAWLKNYPGTLILISHDREFLDATVQRIVHIHQQKLHFYTGNYSSFEQQRSERLSQQQHSYERQQQHIAHLQSFIDRFKAKASKAKQAQSRIKALERLEKIAAAHIDSPFSFSFLAPQDCPNPLISLSNVQLGYNEKCILNNVNLSLVPGSRIGLLGPNGAGKSTLIKALAGQLTPLSGKYETFSGLTIGYFAQHQIEQLQLTQTPLEHLHAIANGATEQQLRNFLGGFDFSGDMALTPVHHFSGGEKSRLALAILVWKKPNLLLLDEPTNHLDLEMRHALTLALQNFQGAMVIVSHDRHLLRTAADSLILVANQQVMTFNDDLDQYQQWLQNYRRDRQPAQKKITAAKTNTYEKQKERRALTAKLSKIEQQLTELSAALNKIETALGDPALYAPDQKSQLAQYLAEQKSLQQQQQEAEEKWLEINQLLEE